MGSSLRFLYDGISGRQPVWHKKKTPESPHSQQRKEAAVWIPTAIPEGTEHPGRRVPIRRAPCSDRFVLNGKEE